ncbi:TIM-barrel domain-containing protein [Pedobacter sp. PWIIR3]
MFKKTKNMLMALAITFFIVNSVKAVNQENLQNFFRQNPTILSATKLNTHTIELVLSHKKRMLIDFYGDNIFRLFQDTMGGTFRDPEAKPEARILVDNPRKPISSLILSDLNNQIAVKNKQITLVFDKQTAQFKVLNTATQNVVLELIRPISFDPKQVLLTLKENDNEYFYGGGVQNGRFSHKGRVISIENQNSWTDGGVASPTPYYWSTKGYGLMWYTFEKGRYDFGAKEKGVVKLSHDSPYLDVFFMIDQDPESLLNDFYQLTGNPVLLPKFGFYEGHLNAYNRDYWKEDPKGILFEDGKSYKESQKDNDGIKESLNGEKNNYQFSARAVIDRYKKNDMPLGWILPNDGYGAGYGQTPTLNGNIDNLKAFGDYAHKNGVEIGLWTQSDLHPKPEVGALLQRDILKEVRDAGVRVLKTDVAWVGAGYSFGLNGVADVAQIMPKYGNDSRPFTISLDGWAGTQRYAAIWSGDQTGGVWEYIRFHIPTYIGSGLSGQPNITSDMDGIFGGKTPIVNIRDFQWKTFSPMQLNMDGWGSDPKYPHALGEPAASINRNYLKLKSALMPYTYSIAKAAVTGLPIIRAIFLEYPNTYTMGQATQYQYLYGSDFLIAPIYQATRSDAEGNDIRNGIYLPEGIWIDYFSGEKYEGNRIINNFDAPLWKLPVFVRGGAIIPMTNPNNNVSEINKGNRIYEFYPQVKSSFIEYDDDGTTEAYKLGKGSTTVITSTLNKQSTLQLLVQPTRGDFNGFVKQKSTEFKINVTQKQKRISAKIGTRGIKLKEVQSMTDYNSQYNVYYYDAAPNFNAFATKGSDFEKQVLSKNPQLLVKLEATDVSKNAVSATVGGFQFTPVERNLVLAGPLTAPSNPEVVNENREAYALKPTWNKVQNADFYEIEFNSVLYSTIKDTTLLFDGLQAETSYSFKIRAVNKQGRSEWTEFKATTKNNPLEFAIAGIVGKASVPDEENAEVDKLFDFDEGNMWHTKWGTKAVPFDLVIDLKSINQLDKFNYLPRTGRGNGVLLKGTVYYSNNKEDWNPAGSFEWVNNDAVKVFSFDKHPAARFLKLSITEGVGNFGSGRELYVFKVPGTESVIPGDINNDHLIDRNDLVSYTNYTGLQKGDADFEGYVSNGDINKNNLIDAYDVSIVATQLDGGVTSDSAEKVSGKIELSTTKQGYNQGETIAIRVKGTNLKSVNALSFALPYNQSDYEFEGVESLAVKNLENLTNDRLHTSGVKTLYPTFVNVGEKPLIDGTVDLFVIKLKAKRKLKFDLKMADGFLVDKKLNTVRF